MEQIVMQKKKKEKKLISGTKEWKEAVSKTAKLLDSTDSEAWFIGDLAKYVPLMNGGKRFINGVVSKQLSPLQQFAIEVAKETKRYKNPKTAYNRITIYRNLAVALEPKYRLDDLSITHHMVVIRADLEGEEAHKKLLEALEKNWTIEELSRNLSPELYEETAKTISKWFFRNWYAKGMDEYNKLFEEMNLRDLSKTELDTHLTSIATLTFETLPKAAREFVKAGAKPDKRILELLKRTKK